jgi:hypothetical protein
MMPPQGGARVPNPTLVFRRADGTHLATRIWYHVPRVDEIVEFDDVSYTVDTVTWTDDEVVIILI